MNAHDPRNVAITAGATVEPFRKPLFAGQQPASPPQADERKPVKASPFIWRDPSYIPRRSWLYPRTYVRKFVTGTVAPGGVGKTGLGLIEALSMVTGRDLLGDGYQGEPLRVWFWNGEDPLEEMERQIHAAMLFYRIMPDDIGNRLYTDSGREMPIRIASTNKSGVAVDVDCLRDITATIADSEIDCAIFDPLVSVHRVPENSNEAMDAVVKSFAQIANDTNCAIGIHAHTRKQQAGAAAEISADDARGGKALVDGARVVRVLNRMTKEEAEKAGIVGNTFKRYFWVGSDKINLTPPDEVKTWRYMESVFLPNGPTEFEGDNMRVVAAWAWPEPFDDVTTADMLEFQHALDKETEQNRADSQSPEWGGHLLASILDLNTGRGLKKGNLTADQLKARSKCGSVLRAWTASGALTTEVIEDTRRKRKIPILRVGTWGNS